MDHHSTTPAPEQKSGHADLQTKGKDQNLPSNLPANVKKINCNFFNCARKFILPPTQVYPRADSPILTNLFISFVFFLLLCFIAIFPERAFAPQAYSFPVFLLIIYILIYGAFRVICPNTLKNGLLVLLLQSILLGFAMMATWNPPWFSIPVNKSWVIPILTYLLLALVLTFFLAIIIRQKLSEKVEISDAHLPDVWEKESFRLRPNILRTGMAVLWLPCIVLIWWPNTVPPLVLGLLLIISWALLGLGKNTFKTPRVLIMAFTSRMPMIVTSLVILLGAAKYIESPYVQIIIESYSHWWHNQIFWGIVVAYTLSFFYLYWENRLFAHALFLSLPEGLILSKPTPKGTCIKRVGSKLWLSIQNDPPPNEPVTKPKISAGPMFQPELHENDRTQEIDLLKVFLSTLPRWSPPYFLLRGIRAIPVILLFAVLILVPASHLGKFIGLPVKWFEKHAVFPQKAQVVATNCKLNDEDCQDKKPGLVDLREHLKKQISPKPNTNRVILIAASGGGSRAALYTQSLLEGLKEIEQFKNIALLSGVSGGSAALAYFAGHYTEENLLPISKEEEKPVPWPDFWGSSLSTFFVEPISSHLGKFFSEISEKKNRNAETSKPWSDFQDAMAAPIIKDVLDGLMEWKYLNGVLKDNPQGPCGLFPKLFKDFPIFGADPSNCYGYRMGKYLEQSLKEYLNIPKNKNQLGISGRNIGLIFNTSVVGCFPKPYCTDPSNVWNPKNDNNQCSNIDLAKCENAPPDRQTSQVGGGRLIMTNLKINTKDSTNEFIGFPQHGHPFAIDQFLPYFIVQDPDIPLTQAASLSGNFPGFFSNAAVDVNNLRYWVTDGGATDNRGAISLLYALLNALPESKEDLEKVIEERCQNSGNNETTPEQCAEKFSYPDIHVIVADASALNDDYSEDRGVSAALSAPTKFASQLIIELKEKIEGILGEEEFHVHYLTMPKVLRSHGGISTHWMVGEEMTFQNPLLPPQNSRNPKEAKQGTNDFSLERNQVLFLLRSLHSIKWKEDSSKEDSKKLMGSHFMQVRKRICDEKNHQNAWQEIVEALPKAPAPQKVERSKAKPPSFLCSPQT